VGEYIMTPSGVSDGETVTVITASVK